MRKIFLFMMITVDGFFEGKDHDISWHNADEEFNTFAKEQTGNDVDILLFGRKTYEMMASYWPTAVARTDDPVVANFMNSLPKIVVSKTLKSAEWENTQVYNENFLEELTKLKAKEGKDTAVFGSSDLCVSLIKAELLDELRIMVNPVPLGEGKRLFEGMHEKLVLKQTTSRTFTNGNVLLTYDVVKE